MAATSDRKHPFTGFWIFVCNTSTWEGDKWLELNETELYYKISKHDRYEIGPGQLGVLRLNDDRRSAKVRGSRPPTEAGVYAIVQTLGPAEYRSDPDGRFYRVPDEADEPKWRVRLRIVANLLNNPILASALPSDDSFQHIRRPVEMATIPLRDEAFLHILKAASVSIGDTEEAVDTLAETPGGIRLLEAKYSSETPRVKAQISRRIERGSVGSRVKKKRRGRCQICEAVGNNPVAFINSKGKPYSEAHHVIPVSHLAAGSLSYMNIMVLCPNHHRQAHYGNFQVKLEEEKAWVITLDDHDVRIDKTEL